MCGSGVNLTGRKGGERQSSLPTHLDLEGSQGATWFCEISQVSLEIIGLLGRVTCYRCVLLFHNCPQELSITEERIVTNSYQLAACRLLGAELHPLMHLLIHFPLLIS